MGVRDDGDDGDDGDVTTGVNDDGGDDGTVTDGSGDDGDIDSDRDGSGDGSGDEGEEYTPPSREEWERVQRALARRRDERNKARAERDKARAELGNSSSDGDGKGDDQQGQQGQQDQEVRWRAVAARSSAATALQAAGFSGTARQAKRLTRLLDVDGAEPDGDGEFDFEEEVADLKEEYPQLFSDKRGGDVDSTRSTSSKSRRPTTADKGAGAEKNATKTPTERTSAELLRSAGIRMR